MNRYFQIQAGQTIAQIVVLGLIASLNRVTIQIITRIQKYSIFNARNLSVHFRVKVKNALYGRQQPGQQRQPTNIRFQPLWLQFSRRRQPPGYNTRDFTLKVDAKLYRVGGSPSTISGNQLTLTAPAFTANGTVRSARERERRGPKLIGNNSTCADSCNVTSGA